MSLSVYPVTDATSRLGKAFFQFPLALHRDTPGWTPPLARDVRRILSNTYPLQRGSRSDACVIVEGSRVLARFVLLWSPAEGEVPDGREARLAMPEAVNRPDVWGVLFDHARAWCREKGAGRFVAPYDLGGTNRAGLLVEGYAEPVAPFHPPYYRDMFEAEGCTPLHDVVSLAVDLSRFGEWPHTSNGAHTGDRDDGMRVEYPYARRRHGKGPDREIAAFLDTVYAPHGAVSHPQGAAVDRPSVTVLRDRRGAVVGCAVPLFDLSPALRRASGYTGLRSIVDLYLERRRTVRRVVDGLSVLAAGGGGVQHLLTGLLRRLAESGTEEVVITGVPASAVSPLIDVVGAAGRVRARHRVYTGAV